MMADQPQKASEMSCATCGLRAKAEENPKSFMARLWRWHTTWCPGWKAYQKALAAEQQ
jgi:hypothetical protein